MQATAKGLYEQSGHDMVRDLVGSDSLVFKPGDFLATMNKDIRMGIARFQMNMGEMSVGRIVLVQDGEDLPILVFNGNMVLVGVEILNRERR